MVMMVVVGRYSRLLLRFADEELGPDVREALAVDVDRSAARAAVSRCYEPEQRREQATATIAVDREAESHATLLFFRESLLSLVLERNHTPTTLLVARSASKRVTPHCQEDTNHHPRDQLEHLSFLLRLAVRDLQASCVTTMLRTRQERSISSMQSHTVLTTS